LSCRKCIGCGICAEVCPKDAIEYSQTEERTDLKVEKIIFAVEMEEKNPPEEYMYQNVVTQIEFERILSESGPYGGIIMRPYDGDVPKRIAFIQVLDADEAERSLSPIAFKLLLQEAKSAKERGVDSCIFAREIYEDTDTEDFVKCFKIHNVKVMEMEERKNLRLKFAVEGEKEEKEEEFDMVVLSVGFRLPEYVKEIGKLMGVKAEEIKFRMPTADIEITETEKDGVFIAV